MNQKLCLGGNVITGTWGKVGTEFFVFFELSTNYTNRAVDLQLTTGSELVTVVRSYYSLRKTRECQRR
jgi:hypothetical protein